MNPSTILLLAIGLPVAAWLVAIAVERAKRRADEFDWHFVDRRLLWTFVVLDQVFLAALEWKNHDPWFWFMLACVCLSASVLVREIVARKPAAN